MRFSPCNLGKPNCQLFYVAVHLFFYVDVAQQQQMFNYNGDLATASNFYQTQPITAVTSQDVDLLRTPSLDMSQMDLTTLFTNRQIMNDVFDSVYAPPEDNSLATGSYID